MTWKYIKCNSNRRIFYIENNEQFAFMNIQPERKKLTFLFFLLVFFTLMCLTFAWLSTTIWVCVGVILFTCHIYARWLDNNNTKNNVVQLLKVSCSLYELHKSQNWFHSLLQLKVDIAKAMRMNANYDLMSHTKQSFLVEKKNFQLQFQVDLTTRNFTEIKFKKNSVL